MEDRKGKFLHRGQGRARKTEKCDLNERKEDRLGWPPGCGAAAGAEFRERTPLWIVPDVSGSRRGDSTVNPNQEQVRA